MQNSTNGLDGSENIDDTIRTEEPVDKIDTPIGKPSIATPTDRHSSESDTYDEREFDMTSDEELEAVVLPASKKSLLTKLLAAIESMSGDTLKSTYTKRSLGATGVNIQNINLTNDNDVYSESLEVPEDWVNKVNYSDKELVMKRHAVNTKGVLTGSSAVAKFASKLSIGEYTSIPLWHSGFWVTIRPPYDDDIVNLESALSGNEIRLGRDTSTLIYSNYSVVYNRILTDFIVNHITATSLDVPNDVNITDLISVQDFYPILLGLITSMNPRGYSFIKNCVNTVVLDDNDVPKCDFSVTGTVNPMNMLRVDRKSLNTNMLEQMSKRRPNTLTVDEVKEYQLSISSMSDKTYEITTGNNSIVKMTLSAPTLSEYIDNGEAWINDIVDRTEKLFTEADSDERKNEKVKDTLNSIILGVYNIFVKKIETDDGDYVEEKELVDDVLNMLSSENTILKQFIDIVKKYIDSSAIAIVATNAYTCPKCEEEQDTSSIEAFKEFIPINALEHFFVISTLRLEKVRNRTVSE